LFDGHAAALCAAQPSASQKANHDAEGYDGARRAE
jgi:hypothetical protein